jgi:peroxiredoxin
VVVGESAPSFELPDTAGETHAFPVEPAPPATVVIQTCNHCPYVIAWNPRLRQVAEDYAGKGVRFLAINSNNAETHPADSLDHMKRFVSDQNWPIPYLHDESQEVARALDAVATPHVFVFDSSNRLAYQGAPDSDHTDDSQQAGWLRGAIDAVLAGQTPDPAETPPRGCSVKWK